VPFPALAASLHDADYRVFLALMIPNTLFYFAWDTLVLTVVIRWFHGGVPYRDLISPFRAAAQEHFPRTFGEKLRRWLAAHDVRLRLRHLAVIGAVVGYITGIVVTTGPVTVPIFLMYGLVKGAFLATEAAGSLAIYVAKVLAFRGFGAMPLDIFVKGLITGSSLMVGTFLSRRFVVRLDADAFRYMLDGLMLVSGLAMLWNAFAT